MFYILFLGVDIQESVYTSRFAVITTLQREKTYPKKILPVQITSKNHFDKLKFDKELLW